MPSIEELLPDWERYWEYYRRQRVESGVASPFEVYWMGHVSGAKQARGEQVDPKYTEWMRDPNVLRIYSKEHAYQRIVDEVNLCRNCPLHASRTKTVPGEGTLRAEIMLVGEAPGKDEDACGRPFVGRSGQILFDDILAQKMGWPRHRIFVTNTLKCQPPSNRDPEPIETQACKHFLDRQISLVSPKVILAAGKHAGRWLTGLPLQTWKGAFGTVHWYGIYPVVCIPHPAAYARQMNTPPDQRQPDDYGARIWDGLMLANQILAKPFDDAFWNK